jgi:hypothetical protein
MVTLCAWGGEQLPENHNRTSNHVLSLTLQVPGDENSDHFKSLRHLLTVDANYIVTQVVHWHVEFCKGCLCVTIGQASCGNLDSWLDRSFIAEAPEMSLEQLVQQ